MAITQISKIQLRRGLASELPGIAITVNPPTFNAGLDLGELGVATDTGQMFMGANPTVGQPNYQRLTFPYQNIEVLTENSIVALQNITDGFTADSQTAFNVSGALATNNANNALDYTTVTFPTTGNPSNPLRLDLEGSFGCYANMTYTVMDLTGKPTRVGTMAIIWDGLADSPVLVDTAAANRRIVTGSETSSDPNTVYGSLSFRAIVSSNGQGQIVVLQCRNLTPTNPYLYYQITRPAV